MYSMVLMMAMSGSAAMPATFGHGCHGYSYGCSGCYGYGSCWGGGYGCSGYACSGCWGGGYGCYGGGHGCHGLFGRLFSGHGRCNGCYGYHGGYCHGGYCYGAYYGACYGACHGAPAAPPAKQEEPKKDAPPPAVGSSKQATLIVTLPAEATLTIDGEATSSKAAVRTFLTPELKPGVDYVYTLKAEITRDGRTDTAEKQVTVRAGQETRATIEVPVVTASK